MTKKEKKLLDACIMGPVDDVYLTDVPGVKVAQYEECFFVWCDKWEKGFRRKIDLLTFLEFRRIEITKVQEE
jgi:hypothetical protein